MFSRYWFVIPVVRFYFYVGELLDVLTAFHLNRIEILKQQEDILILFPYSMISETLQRIFFHLAAMESNKNSVLVFEEPGGKCFSLLVLEVLPFSLRFNRVTVIL